MKAIIVFMLSFKLFNVLQNNKSIHFNWRDFKYWRQIIKYKPLCLQSY